jgi:hypothetical protein
MDCETYTIDGKTFTAHEAALAIVTRLNWSVAQVKAFYIQAEGLRGTCALVDAILDDLDAWLIPHTFNLTVPDLDTILATYDTDLGD